MLTLPALSVHDMPMCLTSNDAHNPDNELLYALVSGQPMYC